MNVNIRNKKVYHDYFVDETLECGMSLKGNEVKSILDGRASIKEAWVAIQDGELVVRGMHISPWVATNAFDINETRERVLLAHKKEIRRLEGIISQDGYTLIPLRVYFNNKRLKMEVGVCRGKHNYDKRQALKTKEANRDIQKAFKNANK